MIKHNTDCKMVFGRKDPSCARCRELIAGAAPIKWNNSRREQDERHLAEARAHDCRLSNCGVVCTFGEW